jgi:hypothetical protein
MGNILWGNFNQTGSWFPTYRGLAALLVFDKLFEALRL